MSYVLLVVARVKPRLSALPSYRVALRFTGSQQVAQNT